jgi:hypothetical protein
MDCTIKIGDIFILPSVKQTGFLITKSVDESVYGEEGFKITWFDDGLVGTIFKNHLSELVFCRKFIKLSDADAFLIKLKFAHNL